MIEKQIFETINEGATEVLVYKNKEYGKGPGSKEGVPFYNPSMELNRDLSVLMGQCMLNGSKEKLKFLDGLAASGIRGLRFANELEGDFEVYINDWDLESYDLIKKNIERSEFENVKFSNSNLNTLLSENRFHYIDIDPFGSPVHFIDSAMRSILNNGIIACTATDTATLCG
ncbi:MAG TPA: tRNA (guanine(10)-N(2))-dimethyltransferase, partial [Bacteroidetes bacterium]|nr:tRNA (guanine(10)-N(2))-dimethyltransferase [Bacteroidota bacterium]